MIKKFAFLFLSFILVCAYFVGVIGGIGWAIYNKAYLIGACVLLLGVMAYPTAKKCFHFLSEAGEV